MLIFRERKIIQIHIFRFIQILNVKNKCHLSVTGRLKLPPTEAKLVRTSMLNKRPAKGGVR